MNSPTVIIDARSPQEAFDSLNKEFNVIPFITKDITYDAIAGHPDIFFAQYCNIIASPNTPKQYLEQIPHIIGTQAVGKTIECSTYYNCLITDNYIIHKQGFTDKKILEIHENKQFISTPQAYTRCNTIEITSNVFLTSDIATCKILRENKLECLFVKPNGIELPPYQYGFIGGCMGKCNDTIYINGSLSQYAEGQKIKDFLTKHKIEYKELHHGKLYDGGGIFFV